MQDRAEAEPASAPPGFGDDREPSKCSNPWFVLPIDKGIPAQARSRRSARPGNRSLLSYASLLVLAVVSCDGSPSAAGDDASYVHVPMSPVVVEVGKAVQLSFPSEVTAGTTATWQSSAAGVATVSASGLVTAVGPGQAQVVAKAKRHRATWSVTVPEPERVSTVTTIAVTPGAVDLLLHGTAQLTAEARDQDGQVMGGAAFAWESADPGVATVSPSGLVAAVGAGTATIRVHSGGRTGTAAVTVTLASPVLTAIEVTPASPSVQAGATVQLSAVAKDQYGNTMTGVTFAWSTANPGIATVSSSGLVWGVAAGTVAVSASSAGRSGSASVTVTQAAPVLTAIALTPATVTLQAGATVQLSAAAKDQYGNTMAGVTLSWASANPAIATVSASGLVTGVTAGTVAITASGAATGPSVAAAGPSASSSVSVTAAAPVATSIALAPATVSLAVGATQQLTPTVKDQNGATMSGVTTTFASSNAAVASVSSSGLVTGVAAGSATITATASGKSATSQVTVSAPAVGAGARPVAKGIWISKAELDALPMSGTAWTGTGELKNTADAAWTVQAIEVQSGQKYNVQAMAGALVFARLYPDPAAEAYRLKVVQAIRTVMAQPVPAGASATAPNRFLGTWAITADLINLPAHDPALDAQFRAWLTQKLDQPYESGKTVRYQLAHANNQGSWATFSIAAASAYLGDKATLDRLALRYRRWLGNTSVAFTLKWTDDQSFQMNPGNSATWVGINPKGAARDGNNFDGLQPSDQNRGAPMLYDAASFPNDFSAVRYNETSLHGVVGAVLILHRAGYTDLVDASDQAILRASKWVKWAADNYSSMGYVYFTATHEAARPLINYFYPTSGLPGTRSRAQLDGCAYGYSWTYWTHAGRSIR